MVAVKIKKRDGTVVDFQVEKITNAIFKAAKAVGGKDKKIAEELANRVAAEIEKTVPQGSISNVEEVQDIVEKILVESGHYKTAKAYILYRQQRAELRKEIQKVLEKAEIDDVDKKFDLNALRVLKARYLRKDENGRLIETPKQLFTRIAVHTVIPNLFYDPLVFDLEGRQKIHEVDKINFADYHEKFSIGAYKLNKYHMEAVWRLYKRFDGLGQMKVDFNGFLDLLFTGKFNHHEKDVDSFFNLMAGKVFLPNTPTIANFGSMLGMGSACFHPDQPITTEDGVKSIKDVKLGDVVLTHRGRFRKVKEVFIRDAKSLLSVKCHKLPASTLLVTDEHPILAFRGGEANWYPAYSLTKNDYVALSHPVEIEDINEIKIKDFVPEVQVDDEGNCFYNYEGGKFNAFKHVTKTVKNTIVIDYKLMKAFGFYLSEGCISEADCVRFTFSHDEREYCNEVVEIFRDKFGVEARIEETDREDRNWLSLRFHSTILAKFFLKIFGTGFNQKKVPSWILKLPVEKQKGLMEGMIKGDGTVFSNGANINAKLVMCNQSLVYAFWQLCMRCGVFTSLGYETMPKLGTEGPVRCQIGGREGTTLMEELYQRELQEEDTKFVTDNKVKNINGVTFTQVEAIEKIAYDGPVYNFEVEEDHSYVANMVSVHNCFVLRVPDSIDGIMETLKDASIIFKAGGGVGYNFSELRPEGDFVSSTCGVASGPITFMTMFDKMTEVIKQGGIRRGANMGIININHPDIEKFIVAKDGNKQLKNFNISVLVMPDFWDYYNKNEPYPLRNPRNGDVVRTVSPRMLFDMIVYQAWESAEPGIIFYDKVNKYNPFVDHLGPIVTTNPCVTADTLIPTENGLERIDFVTTENIVVDTRAIEGHGQQTSLQMGTLVKPLQVVKTGIKEVYKLTTKSGYELEATPDHKILTNRGWVALQKLTNEDNIFIQSGAGKFREEADISFKVENDVIGENGRQYSFNLPNKWSFDLGLVLGWLTGDGFISKKHNTIGFVFAPEDKEAKEKIQPILEDYFDREITPALYENGCVQLRSNSKHIVDFFIKLGVNPDQREVPKSLFTASKDAVLGFLSGLFSSDGTIKTGKESRNYIRLNSSSLKLLKQVQLLLLNLGIRASIYDRSTKPKVFTYTTKDGEVKEYQTSGVNYELNISKKNLERFLDMVGFIQERNKNKIESLRAFEFYQETFTDKIVSKEPVGKKEVWDITEPLTHSFIANGIVVHNCGEVLLYPNESCNLGSINVWSFAKEDDHGQLFFDWDGLKDSVVMASRFLDNVIDVNKYPLQAIEDMTLATRKIGLGVMGVADLLYELKLSYNTDEGRKFMEKLMEFINYWSKVASIGLAKERGKMPYYDKSFYQDGKLPFAGFDDKESWSFDWNKIVEEIKQYGVRNGFTIVIAPTGSISMIAGCSSGIEPVYSLAFEKNIKVGSFYYVNHVFEKIMKREGLHDDCLMADVSANGGSVQKVSYMPSDLKRVFITAMDTTPEDHIRALATFQKWVDSSISKTNNFPADATMEHMRESYLLAYKLGCKDVTVYRDGSIKGQVLVSGAKKKEGETKAAQTTLAQAEPIHQLAIPALSAEPAFSEPAVEVVVEPIALAVSVSNGAPENMEFSQPIAGQNELTNCPECSMGLAKKEGCLSCPECGWGLCK